MNIKAKSTKIEEQITVAVTIVNSGGYKIAQCHQRIRETTRTAGLQENNAIGGAGGGVCARGCNDIRSLGWQSSAMTVVDMERSAP